MLLCLTDTSLYTLSTIRHEITSQRPVGTYQYSAPIRLAFSQQDYKFENFLVRKQMKKVGQQFT